jgi:2-amino-4-hydroxy-6-hydroxymethyldihydropteridine diphosphokinase
MTNRVAYVGLGTNVGDRAVNLRTAIAGIAQHASVRKQSSVYQTEPVGYADQRSFWNMVVEVTTSLNPRELLTMLVGIEEEMGRKRTFRNAPRIIDLDILLFGDDVVHDAGLELPHPRMTERAFVLLPLVELQPNLTDPVSGERFADILAQGSFEAAERLGSLEEIHE